MSTRFRFARAILAVAATFLSLLATSSVAAQGTTSPSGFIVRLGSDTLAVERFTRTGNRLEGDLVQRSPMTRVAHYVVTLDDRGVPSRVEYTIRRPDGSMIPRQPRSLTVVFGPDSIRQEIGWGDSTSVQHIAATGSVFPLSNSSYAMYELALAQLRASGRDSGTVTVLPLGAPRTFEFPVAFVGRDSVRVHWFGDPLRLRVDSSGRLLGADGSATTLKVNVERVADVDVERIAASFAAREAQGGAMGQLSTRDTTEATIGAARIWVDYGRPRARGRTIFGGVVPWNAVWRTGANAATQFRTDRPIELAGVPIPAGTYTLWTLPTPAGDTLIVNRQTGQWGTAYDPAQDLARVPLTRRTLPAPVEAFTIALEPAGTGGTLRLSWDRTELSAPIVVK